MNNQDDRYSKFALCREMLETTDVVRRFDPDAGAPFAQPVKAKSALFLTGEGSSRIFPAKRAMRDAMAHPAGPTVATEGATQALEYDLSHHAVFGASNSGKTKEVVRLLDQLSKQSHNALFGLVAHDNTSVANVAHQSHVLTCGMEKAVAATKSVVEQALFYDSLLHILRGEKLAGLDLAADHLEAALTQPIDPALTEKLAAAGTIYFAGRNDGVAEELTLKINEITKKASDYLEGTYAVHGIEEVMDPADVVVVIDPFPDEEAKFDQCLVQGVGMTVIAIAERATSFPTVQIPGAGHFGPYVQLAAGWSLLVEIGLALDINLDTAERARKVGNEFIAS